ncbi:MAG: hypothetical protein ACTHMY_12845 [Solirubrobacteraceae bacterium]
MAPKKRKKRQRQKKGLRAATRLKARTRPERPTPVTAIEMRHAELASRLAARADRFSELLGKSIRDQRVGGELISRSGLSEAERAELESLWETAHERVQQEALETTSSLRGLLTRGDPLYILSVIQASNLLGRRGEYYEPTHRGLESKVELVAGLLLTQPASSDPPDISSQTLQAIHDALDTIMDVMLLRNLTAPRGEDSLVAELRFTGAWQWMTVRGTSYAHHGRELARAIYQPFDNWCSERYGFVIDDVLTLAEAVHALWNERMSSLFAEAAAFANQVGEHIRKPEQRNRLPAEARAKLDSPEEVRSIVQRAAIELYEQGVREAASFTVDDLVQHGLPRDRVEAVLKELSLSAGSLNVSDYTGLFDPSPLVEHPFFEFNGRFLLVVPGMLLRDTVAVLENRFMTAVRRFSAARAKTLDALAVEYVTELLPESQGFTNLFYQGAELDGLVLFDRTAFVIEGKGTALSMQARRGDIARLKRDIGRAVDEAWDQGARARAYILSDEHATFLDEDGHEVVCIPAGSVDAVFIVNPTLHQLAGHASQLPRLRGLGLFAAGEFPWSVFINDLRVISETCDNAAVFLHYLIWRDRLPLGDQITVTDELDLWSSYLLCERFGSLGDAGHYIVGNASTDFDDYYAGVLGEGSKAPKPGKFLEEPLRTFVDRMARERPPRWLEAAGVCLDLSIPEQAFVCARTRALCREADKTGDTVIMELGRVRLVALPRGASLTAVMAATDQDETDTTFDIYVRGSKAKRGEIAWARQVKPVTFDLSEYERAALIS